MFHSPFIFALVALAAFALLAVWLAVEPRPRRAAKRIGYRLAIGALSAAIIPLAVDPSLHAYVHASGQGREGIAKRTARKVSGGSIRLRGAFRAFRSVGLEGLWSALRNPLLAKMFVFPMAGADGATDLLDDDVFTEGDKKLLKDLGEQTTELRAKLVGRLGEMKANGEDKSEVEKREKELAEKVDKILGLTEKSHSSELEQFKAELGAKLDELEGQFKDFGRLPARGPQGASSARIKDADKYEGENLFLDMKEVAQKGARGGMREKAEAIAEYEEKFNGPERLKAWANGDLEEVDLILPDIQQALPFLRAQARAVRLFREIRTSAPSVEFPVFKSGLKVDHVKDGEKKPESEPEFDLEVARVFTIAGISDVPNPTLEDFPSARGWIATELGAATGAQEEIDVLLGSGEGEPLGLYKNKDIPTRKLDVAEKASAGRNIITSAFRAAQQVRIKGFMEPTDILMSPAAWTDVALSFEDAIGFLYGPIQTEGSSNSGPVLDQPPPRILGLPVTWSAYVPLNEGEKEEETSVVVGNFNDGIILRRAPFRIDVDTSIGFKNNLTSFRGEERMGFIVVRPKSFVRVTGIKPSPVE